MRPTVPLRVAIYDPAGQGGICHYTYQLARSLAQLGIDVTVMTTENYELKHLPRNFKITFLFKESWIKRLALSLIRPPRWQGSDSKEPALQNGARADKNNPALTLFRTLRLRIIWVKAACLFLWKRPDLIHFQWSVDRKKEHFFINLLKLLHFKIVYTVHDLLPLETDSDPAYDALGKTYRTVDALIVHTKNSKKELVSLFNVDPEKIYVIPHGSYDVFYTDKKLSKEVAKEELGLTREKKVILFFGLIKRYKGLEYLVEAFQEIKEQIDNAMLLVVGRIYDADAEEFIYYSRLIDQIRNRSDAMCVPDYVPFERIGCYFSAADVVVLPYTKTYTSGVLLAAYAAGRPVVVTDTGALSEVVESGKSGMIVPPKDSKALSRAIVETLNSSDIEEMGSYAKHLAETKYSWKRVASKTTDLYRTLTLTANVPETRLDDRPGNYA